MLNLFFLLIFIPSQGLTTVSSPHSSDGADGSSADLGTADSSFVFVTAASPHNDSRPQARNLSDQSRSPGPYAKKGDPDGGRLVAGSPKEGRKSGRRTSPPPFPLAQRRETAEEFALKRTAEEKRDGVISPTTTSVGKNGQTSPSDSSSSITSVQPFSQTQSTDLLSTNPTTFAPPSPKTTLFPGITDIFHDDESQYSTTVSNIAASMRDTKRSSPSVGPKWKEVLVGVNFSVQPHPVDPFDSLLLFYTSVLADGTQLRTKFSDLKVNYTDLNAGAFEGLNGDPISLALASSPFKISGLYPGHEYRVEILGRWRGEKTTSNETTSSPSIDLDEEVDGLVEGRRRVLFSEVVTTDPRTPIFLDEGIETGERDLSLRGVKVGNSIQDYFLVEYRELESPSPSPPPLNVSDLPQQRRVELYVPKLEPGRSYNVSVTAHRRGRSSQAWDTIVTTKPLAPKNLKGVKKETTTLELEWETPVGSGVDGYRVIYAPIDGSAESVQVKQLEKTRLPLSEALFPGKTYKFEVYSEKSNEQSLPATIEVTMKPLAPVAVTITPDLRESIFKIDVDLESPDRSVMETCKMNFMPEADGSGRTRKNVTAPIFNKTGQPKCQFRADLIPGKRYTFEVSTLSEEAESSSFVHYEPIKPAFDADLFGIQTAVESHSIGVNWNEELWGHGLQTRSLWQKMVGPESNLTAKLEGTDAASNETVYLASNSPYKMHNGFIKFEEGIISGACYSLLLYATTPSGIVSETRTSKFLRTLPPKGALEQTGAARETSVNLSLTIRTPSSGSALKKVDSSCHMIVVTRNSSAAEVNRLSVSGIDAPSKTVTISELQPYSRYEATVYVRCGAKEEACNITETAWPPLRFNTTQGKPDTVTDPQVKAQSPVSAILSWRPPLRPNGDIIGYQVKVLPVSTGGNESSDWTRGSWVVDVGAGESELVVGNLSGGRRFQFQVRARTQAGLGKAALSQTGPTPLPYVLFMPIARPPKPATKPEILEKEVTASSLVVNYDLSEFSERNGKIDEYAVIVREESEGTIDKVEFRADQIDLNWQQVRHSTEDWPPYIAAKRAFKPNTIAALTIGADRSCLESRGSEKYCNGPLKPDSRYRVKIRAYTAADLYTDTDYSDPVRTAKSQGSSAAVVVAVVVSILVILALALAILLVFKKRRKASSGSKSERDSKSSSADSSPRTSRILSPAKLCPNSSNFFNDLSCPKMDIGGMIESCGASNCFSRAGLRSQSENSGLGPNPIGTTSTDGAPSRPNGRGGPVERIFPRSLRERAGIDGRLERLGGGGSRFSLPSIPTVISGHNPEKSRPVKVVDIAEHVRLMSADSDFRFSEEFEDLKQVGRNQPCTASELACNRNKNRFTNILPFDHSRVKLVPIDDDEEGSDYINANYIPGLNSPREFIATQGPLPSTRDDFWRMVWEQQCPAIVNLTRCIEKGREKCDMYWPQDTDPITYGDIEVAMMNETRTSEWSMREFRLTNLGEPGPPWRMVKHFHFLGWPDFGVPDRPQALLRLVRAFRRKVPPDNACKPSIVHCSAGVGRSGTFITLDRLIQSVERGLDSVDVFGIVYSMRKERVWMVQTEQQYICIHQCLLCVLEGREHEDSPSLPPAYPIPVPTPVIGGRGGGYPLRNTHSSPVPSIHSSPFHRDPRQAQPRVEVHQNPAFEDDEGIAESGV